MTNVLSDVMGQTGMRIICDILAGVRVTHQLAQHRDHRCSKSAQEIAKSLEGDYRGGVDIDKVRFLEPFKVRILSTAHWA